MAEKRTSKSSASAGTGGRGKAGAGKRSGETGQEAKKPRSSASAAKPKGGASKAGSGSNDRDQRVRDRAYEIWEQEGRPSGREREHWERANREIGS